MKGTWSAFCRPRVVFFCTLMSACGGSGSDPVGPASNAAPVISGIVVTPSTVAPGGQAAVVLKASDPDGDVLTCHFSADHGIVTIGDSSHSCSSATYENNRDGASSDMIHGTVTDSVNNSASTVAGITIAGSPTTSPTPTPRPTPTPTPGPSPTPKPSPTPAPTPPPPSPPTVAISGGGSCHPKSPSSPCNVSFSASASNGAPPLSYSWSGCTSGNATSANCSVNAINTFTATVTVTDSLSRSASVSGTATGTNVAPSNLHQTGTDPAEPVPNNTSFKIFYAFDESDGDSVACTVVGKTGPCSSPNCGGTIYGTTSPAGSGTCRINAQVCDVWGACTSNIFTLQVQ
jgi:hypothetical protein